MSDAMAFARSLAQKSWAERQAELGKGQQSMVNTASATEAVGASMVNTGHFMDAYVTNTPYRRNSDTAHVTIKQAANGWIINFAPEEGAAYTTYICNTPQEIAERITACLVEHKLQETR